VSCKPVGLEIAALRLIHDGDYGAHPVGLQILKLRLPLRQHLSRGVGARHSWQIMPRATLDEYGTYHAG
jgi:hypothetical protein